MQIHVADGSAVFRHTQRHFFPPALKLLNIYAQCASQTDTHIACYLCTVVCKTLLLHMIILTYYTYYIIVISLLIQYHTAQFKKQFATYCFLLSKYFPLCFIFLNTLLILHLCVVVQEIVPKYSALCRTQGE